MTEPTRASSKRRFEAGRTPTGSIDHSAFVEQHLLDVTRVLAVNQAQEIGPARLTLLSLELYRDGAVAQFLLTQDRRGDPDQYGLPQFRVAASDDAQTRYADRSHGGSGSSLLPTGFANWRMAHAFAPAVPASAQELRLRVDAVVWLGRGGETTFAETSRTEGPWEFRVAL